MKKNWYRSGWLKAIAILLSYVMIVGAAFGAVVLFQMGRAGVSLECDEHFTDSWTFANLVYDNGYRIETELKSKIVKEALAEEKDADTIDVGAFYNGDTPSITEAVSPSKGKETGLVYASEDMFKWAREKHDIGLHGYDYPILKCKTAEGKYHYFYYEEFVQGVVDGTIRCEVDPHAKEWFFGDTADGGMLNNHSRDEIQSYISYVLYGDVDSLGKITVDTMQSSKTQEYVSCIPEGDYNANLLNPETKKGELYAPEGYENLLDFLNQDTGWWNDKLEMAYNALDSALNELQFYAGGQNNELSAYENGKTNVTYLYADLDNRKIYTNEKAYEDISLLEKNLESMKKQICIQIQSGKASFSNINNIVQDNYLGSLEYHADAISDVENYVFALEIDSAFKADDKLAAANEAFNKYAGQLKKVLVFEFVCGVLWLLLMVYLTMVAGRSVKDDEIHINGFDRIYTEIGAALVIGIWFTCFFFGMNLYFPRDDRQIMAVWATGMGGLTQTFILIGWLSLVRRIKARNFWKNSICKIACSWIYKIFKKIMGVFGLILNRIKEFIYGKDILLDGLRRINNGEIHYKIPSEKLFGKRKVMADYINNMGSGLDAAVDKAMRSERMKTDLITNVSHDIKTPLTSIINYVDLLKRENFTDPKIQGYLQVLDEKSQRLKILTEDVVEASKASSGNINLEMTDLDFVELIHQVLGEFEEKFEQKNLTMMVHFEDEASVIKADGQRMWRVLSNIFGNVVKYAMEGTRVYAEVSNRDKKVVFSLKNISAQPLNISADELTERFIRGDISRNTEGSGLGLSIAKSLTELQGGEFKLVVDGDLFKVMITFAAEEKK